jgi:hypothetical protein
MINLNDDLRYLCDLFCESSKNLTLGELVIFHQVVDLELNRQLNISPITDTLDLRSSHIRKESYQYEFDKAHEDNGLRQHTASDCSDRDILS